MASVSFITTTYRANQADATLPADADVAAEHGIAEERGAYRVNGANGARPATAESAPLSCITGDAKSVTRAIIGGAFSRQMQHFLGMVLDRTFGNAGWQKRAGAAEPGVWCAFDLAAWTRDLGWRKPNVVRMRDQLVSLGVLRYESDAARPGSGRLGWNLAMDEWLPLQDAYRRARYTRTGAGRPRATANQASIINQKTNTVSQAGVIAQIISGSEVNLTDNGSFSNRERVHASKIFKPITDGSLESWPEAARREPLRKREKKEEETDTYVSGAVADAPPTAPAKRKPRYSGEEQAYVRQVVVALLPLLNAKSEKDVWGIGAVRAAVHWFYRARDGDPVPPDEVAEWYRLTKRDPFWQHRDLPLAKVIGAYTAHKGGLAEYRKFIASLGGKGGNGYAARQPGRHNGRYNGGAGPGAVSTPDELEEYARSIGKRPIATPASAGA